MKKSQLRIKAHLRTEATGCDYSGHFRKHWIDNEKLHPAVKEIPVQEIETNLTPKVEVYDGRELLYQQEGNLIRLDLLQEYILKHLNNPSL